MSEKKKRGRPPKDPADRQRVKFTIKLTEAEREQIDAATDTPCSWAREVLLRAARRINRRS